jgi:inosine-uridine nucleoside N-ribohydrolase
MRCAARRQQQVLLVATAALTNVALLLTLFPDVQRMVKIVVMGGCLGVGNTGAPQCQ